jgi:dTDP-4-amino-4,6-dideoxygalactose transaminase
LKVEFFRHSLEKSDIENVSSVLNSLFLTTGAVNEEFERRFASSIGAKETVTVNSCTAGLHLSLLALGVGPGHEVITTPMTFIATVTTIMHVGATPVFVDAEDDTGLVDAGKIEAAITPRTKAILPVHLYGTMADMKKIRDIADRHGLRTVEDSAHCIEGERDGVRPGQLSEAACFSFYATKNLTCGEGGAVTTNDTELAARLRVLRLHGMSKDAINRYHGAYQHWDMVELGWKYNLDDIHAALLVGQLGSLDSMWRRREEISRIYDGAFSTVPEVRIPKVIGKSARHLYTIWVDPKKRDQVLHKMHEHKIGVAVNYRSVHNLSFFRKTFGFRPEDFPNANRIGESTITLPLYPKLTDSEVEYVIESVKHILRAAG